MAVDSVIRCPVCGERVGVYEPAAVLEVGKVRYTSRAACPGLEVDGRKLFHAACLPPPGGGEPPASGRRPPGAGAGDAAGPIR